MKRIDAGTSGTTRGVAAWPLWTDIGLPAPWPEVAGAVAGSDRAKPIQVEAFRKGGVLTSRRNLIVSAPTNGGKSLVGTLTLLDAVRQGGRAILIEPLRAIARERADDYLRVLPSLGRTLGGPIAVRLTTGDVRLDEEELASPPPEDGQLVIATPERLDAILRNPDYEPWIDSVRAICVDEAHLISDRHRGPTLEFVITSFLTLPTPPRVLLLSATMGGLPDAAEWLEPCDILEVSERQPALQKEVLKIDERDDSTEILVDEVRDALESAGASVLVFVYQTASAVKLARELTERLGARAGVKGALAYHAQMSTAQRTQVREACERGESRVIVSTTALAMGVNLPATHVIVRDSTFFGEGKLEAGQLLQMLGRAGRGDRMGKGVVIVKPADGWDAESLANALRREEVPTFSSALAVLSSAAGRAAAPRAAPLVAALLARSGDLGRSACEIIGFAGRTLAGSALTGEPAPGSLPGGRRAELPDFAALSPSLEPSGPIGEAIEWLFGPEQRLAWRDDMDRFHLTKLGLAGVRAAIPLQFTAGVGRLIRDLLEVEADDETLREWTPLDSLLVIELLAPNPPNVRSFSEALAAAVDAWADQQGASAPVLFRRWIRGNSTDSKAAEVLGSLGVDVPRGGPRSSGPREFAYRAILRTIVLHERSRGASSVDIERDWSTKPGMLEGVEERWRDTDLWLLAGLTRILDARCFSYHLRNDCAASDSRVQDARDLLRKMRREAYELMGGLERCSPLAGLLGIGREQGGRSVVGQQTVEKLEDAGIRSLSELRHMTTSHLVQLGVSTQAAKAIVDYLVRAR